MSTYFGGRRRRGGKRREGEFGVVSVGDFET